MGLDNWRTPCEREELEGFFGLDRTAKPTRFNGAASPKPTLWFRIKYTLKRIRGIWGESYYG